jgi:hypothetical protein
MVLGMRRTLLLTAAVAVLLTFLGGAHWFLARRLVLDAALMPPVREGLLATIALLGTLLVLQPLADRALGPPAARVLAWPAGVWMGMAFFLLVSLAVSEVAVALLGRVALAGLGGAAADGGAARALVAVTAAAVATAAGLVGGLRPPMVRRVEIGLSRWPAGLDGFRIVQVGDLHLGPLLGRRFAAEVVARVQTLAADVVAVTGDLVDGTVARLGAEVAPLAGLRARHGVFCMALIEARSCERLGLLAGAVDDPGLAALWQGLLASEARHHRTYVRLAAGLAPPAAVRRRLGELARHEAAVLASGSDLRRLHG